MKPTSPATPFPESTEAEIQHPAYRWCVDGGGRVMVELDNWFTTREFVRHRAAVALTQNSTVRE